MIEKLFHQKDNSETVKRSLVKTISYRLLIIILDFLAIYFFTGKIKIAFLYTIVSNIYSTIIYFLHERIWLKISWGESKPGLKGINDGPELN